MSIRKKRKTPSRRNKDVLEGWAVVRVSKENLVKDGSPKQQLNLIRDWEKRQSEYSGRKYKVVNFIVEDGKSGRYQNTSRRKEILHLAEMVKAGTIDFIVTERLDRLSRDEVFNLQIMRDARRNNIELHEVNYGKFNPNDRGQRMGWKFRNIQAGEYSEGVSEDVARKHRSAMVHNGKDASPRPTLGLDPHKRWVGFYEPNLKEIEIVKDILQKYVDLNYSQSALVEYCKVQGYATKKWWTKGKTKDGEIIEPKPKGGKPFTWDSLRSLLESHKLRGYNFFYDNWNQFPELQDEEGWVKWEYAHAKDNIDLIPRDLWEQVDAGLDQLDTRARPNEFLLSGILFAPDGSKYGGEIAKSGAHAYYYNRNINKRFPVGHLHEKLFSRLKLLLSESAEFQTLVEKVQKDSVHGTKRFDVEEDRILSRMSFLNDSVENFSEAMKKLVSECRENLGEVIDNMIVEKQKAIDEISTLEEELKWLREKRAHHDKCLKGKNFKNMVKTILNGLDQVSPLEQKKLIQTIISKAVLVVEDEQTTLQIIYNLDITGTGRPQSGARPEPNVIPIENSKIFKNRIKKTESSELLTPNLAVEEKSWPFSVNGGFVGDRTIVLRSLTFLSLKEPK